MNSETRDEAMKRNGNDDRLKDERNCRGHVEVRRILDIGLPRHRERQHQRMQREHVEQRIEPVLIELEKAHQHQRTCEQVSDVERQAAHHRLRETNSRSVASKPTIRAPPRNSGTRNTRIFAIEVSNVPNSAPPPLTLPINPPTPPPTPPTPPQPPP